MRLRPGEFRSHLLSECSGLKTEMKYDLHIFQPPYGEGVAFLMTTLEASPVEKKYVYLDG